MQLPVMLRKTSVCERCGLRYEKQLGRCDHCRGLSDQQVGALQDLHSQERRGEKHLGTGMLAVAALLLVIFAVLLLAT